LHTIDLLQAFRFSDVAASSSEGSSAINRESGRTRTVIDSEQLLANIEKLVKSPEAFKLSDVQLSEITELHVTAKTLCGQGKTDEAHEVMVEIQNGVLEGPPEGE
jgi:hypothetical protein